MDRKRAQSLLALVPFVAIAGCGPSESGTATASSPAGAASAPVSAPSEAAPPAPARSSPAPAPSARRTLPAAPSLDRVAGMWRGPRNQDGSTPTIWIHAHGLVTLESGGFTCSGKATPVASKYQIAIDKCAVPMPTIMGTLSADGRTMTIVAGKERETWRLMERPR